MMQVIDGKNEIRYWIVFPLTMIQPYDKKCTELIIKCHNFTNKNKNNNLKKY